MAVVYQYSDVLQNMYGNGDVKQAKRVRPINMGGHICQDVVRLTDFTGFAKSDAGSILYLTPMRWTSRLESIEAALSKTTSSEDLHVKVDVFGATGVPSSRTGDDNARIGNLTKLKDLSGSLSWGNRSPNIRVRLNVDFPYRGKSLYECVNSTDNEKLAFEPFKNTPHGFIGLEVATKSTQMPDDTSAVFLIYYVEGAPSGMPLDKIAI